MSVEDIISRLEKVRRTRAHNWIAACPAHQDKSPSLTLHAADDGRILVRCWAGCSFEEIVSGVGLGYEPWFPPKQADDFKKAVRKPYPAADVLEAIAGEAMVVAVTIAGIANGTKLTPEDYLRMLTAAGRIAEARRIALG